MKKDPKFEKLRLKNFDFWTLYLHTEQYPYIGRCYAWALREDANRITDMSGRERDELFDRIIPEWENAVGKLYRNNWSNFAVFGNTSPHLHAHLIPRYNEPRNFHGVDFVDPRPKGNYSPFQKRDLGEEVMGKIFSEMQAKL